MGEDGKVANHKPAPYEQVTEGHTGYYRNKPGLGEPNKPEDLREGSPEERIFLVESRECVCANQTKRQSFLLILKHLGNRVARIERGKKAMGKPSQFFKLIP